MLWYKQQSQLLCFLLRTQRKVREPCPKEEDDLHYGLEAFYEVLVRYVIPLADVRLSGLLIRNIVYHNKTNAPQLTFQG
jgi:hypothetical protein